MKLSDLKWTLLFFIGACGVADKDKPANDVEGHTSWQVSDSASVSENPRNEPVTQVEEPSTSACEMPTGVSFYIHLRGDEYGAIAEGSAIPHAVFNAPLLVISVDTVESAGETEACFDVEIESLTPEFCQIGGIQNSVVSPGVRDEIPLLERAVYLTGIGECIVRSTIRSSAGDEVVDDAHFDYIGVLPVGRCPEIPE